MALWSINLTEKINELSECSICTDKFTHHKVLPCQHTFCLQCLQVNAAGNRPGSLVVCPLCRNGFTIPNGGMAKLQTNLTVQNLVELNRVEPTSGRRETDLKCDVCEEEVESGREVMSFCGECNENLCGRCCQIHRKQRATRSHKIVDASNARKTDLRPSEEVSKLSDNCRRHPDKIVELFCTDCKPPVCVQCYVVEHNSHRTCTFDEAIEQLRLLTGTSLQKVANQLTSNKRVVEHLEDEKRSTLEQIGDIEKEVVDRAHSLKRTIDVQTQQLTIELNLRKGKALKEIYVRREEVEVHLAELESFKGRARAVLDGAICVDRATTAVKLLEDADELLSKDLCGYGTYQYHITFTPAEMKNNLIGKLSDK